MSTTSTCLYSELQSTDVRSPSQLFIDLSAVAHNVAELRTLMPEGARLMAMLKANGYGTDPFLMAQFLGDEGVESFGLAYVQEALDLRKKGITHPLFVLHAAPYEIAAVVEHRLEVAASDLPFIEAIAAESTRQQKCTALHLHVNTGMNRFGCSLEDALLLAQTIHRSPFLELAGMMTHFPVADDPRQDAFTEKQIHDFTHLAAAIRAEGIPLPWLHATNSSGLLRFSSANFNMARIGLGLYGLHASKECKSVSSLQCALQLTAQIFSIITCKVGETVSYGRSYTVKGKEQQIAVIPLGYHDGIHRRYSGRGHVIVRGQKAPMVGRICMDFMMIDVTEISDCAVGDRVDLFGGEAMTVEDFAACGGTIAHEVIACLGPRIERIFHKGTL